MSKLDSLIVLINSMDNADKRYFGLHCKIYEGEKDYQLLYQIIQKSNFDADSVKTEFRKLRPKASFEITSNHLYQALLEKLSAKDTESEIEFQLLKAYQQARFLFKRNLPQESINLIRKFKPIALENELFSHFLLLAKLEIRILNQLEFDQIDEDNLVRMQSKIESVSRQQRAIENHTGLYNLISLRQIKQGAVRNETEKTKLNDLAFNELQAVSGQNKDSFEAQKLHLLFQSAYFMKTANPKSSLKVYYELNELFENNRKLWGNPPYLYLSHLKGILNNLRWFGKFDEMPFFIEKVKRLINDYPSWKTVSNTLIFLFESLILTDQKKYREALGHLETFFNELSNKNQTQPIISSAQLALQIATVYYWNSEYKKALRTISPFLNVGKSFKQVAEIKTMRYINMMIHLEQNDFDYLDSEIRSFERSLKKKEKLFLSEGIILNVIKLFCRQTNPAKKAKFLENQIRALQNLKNDSYENQFLRSFDFIQWMEIKIEHPSV